MKRGSSLHPDRENESTSRDGEPFDDSQYTRKGYKRTFL